MLFQKAIYGWFPLVLKRVPAALAQPVKVVPSALKNLTEARLPCSCPGWADESVRPS